MKNYGLKFEPKDPNAYVLGGFNSLPAIVLKEDGQWDNWLPVYEPQFEKFETYGCTVWGTQNAIEILIKRLTNFERNFSERFNYILAEVRPPGADPHKIAEVIREYGLIENDYLPMSATYEDFIKPKPMTQNLLDKGMEFPYEVKHEYVKWKNDADRIIQIKNALRFSPLGVSVTAWHEENGVYVDKGKSNNHWCVAFGWNAKGWKIFDSYDQSVKTLSFNHKIEVCKRYYLEANNRLPRISLIATIIKKIGELIGLIKTEAKPTNEVVETPKPAPVEPEPPPRFNWDTPVLARQSVREICDEMGLTVSEKNLICAVIACESGFDTKAVRQNKDKRKSKDYGICQYNSYWYIGEGKPIPSVDVALNDPEFCVRTMIKRYKAGWLKDWVCYSRGLYKQHL